MRIILSNIRVEDQPRVVRLLEEVRECGHLPLPLRANLAALMLLPAHELRAEAREILDAEGRRGVGR